MSGRPTRAAVERWASEVEAAAERIGPRFARSEPRRRAGGSLRRLPGDTERKSGRHPAGYPGEGAPDGVRHLLARAGGDADAARDDLIGSARHHLGDSDGVLVADETGVLKEGAESCGAARRYPGTPGRTGGRRGGVPLAPAGRKGPARLGRALHLPKGWADERTRCRRAGVSDAVTFAPGLTLAGRMRERAVAGVVSARWVTASESPRGATGWATSWGCGPLPRCASGSAGCGSGGGPPRPPPGRGSGSVAGRQRRGRGGAIGRTTRTSRPGPERFARWLLIRRSVAAPAEVAYFACGGPPGTTPAGLVGVAGGRWVIEECLALARGDGGPDEYEVRGWGGWRRHVTRSLFALAVVAVIPAGMTGRRREKGGDRLVRLSVPEVRTPLLSWCGPSSRRPGGCWRGPPGGDGISTAPERATTGRDGRGHRATSYGCRTSRPLSYPRRLSPRSPPRSR